MEQQYAPPVQVLIPRTEISQSIVPNIDRLSWRDYYTQIVASCFVHLLAIQAGVNMAFSTILIPQLDSPDSDLKIAASETPWIASLVTISLPIGSLMSGTLMDRYGRRNIGLFICIPYLISWIIIYWSPNVVWLYVGRVIAGASSGISSVAIVYTSETANLLWRPMLLGLTSVCVSLGILLTSIFGKCFYWRTIAVIFAVINALIFCLITFIPETPHWLLSFHNGTQDSNRIAEARKSVRWFNRRDSIAEKEFSQLLINCRASSAASSPRTETLMEKLRILKSPAIYKPIIILLFIFFFQQFSGSYAIIFYAVQMFEEVVGDFDVMDEYDAMIAMAAIRLVMAIVALLLSRRLGRRTLCMISGLGMGISILSAALNMQIDPANNGILTLIFVMLFICFGAIGWQIVPWTLTGELLPTKARGIVGGIMISYAYLLMFVIVTTDPALKESINLKGVFFIYGIFAFLSTAFVWKFLPETFGKSLAQIEQYFR